MTKGEKMVKLLRELADMLEENPIQQQYMIGTLTPQRLRVEADHIDKLVKLAAEVV